MALNWKPFSGENGSNALNGLMSTAGSVVGKVGGNLISGGKSTTAGGVMSGMADIAAAIPGPIGAIASAGLGLLGGITNAAFGTKWNDENIAKVESNINDLKSFQTNAGDYDALTQTWKSSPVGMSFNNDYIGKDGWFSNKAANKANDFRNQIAQGTDWVNRSLVNNADNIANINKLQREANYRALGGFLPSFDTNGSTALMWDFATDYMNNKYGDSNDNTDFSVNPALNNIYAKGGKIHIKPSKRGTFTAAAKKHNMGVQEFASRVLANPDNYSPAMRKKANFAASKWKHADGGPLNPYSAGALVDAMYSSSNGDKFLGKPSHNYDFTISGDFSNGVTQINSGGLHSTNPYEGVQMGVDPEGNPNLVEEGEVVYNDYVFSDRLTVPKDIRKKYKLGKKNITFAEAAKKMQKESEERPNDPISKNGLESLYTMLADYQEIERGKQMKNTKGNKYANGSFLRYAPVLGSAIGLTENLLKRPDYSSVQRIADAANLAGEYTPIGYTPLGEYMTYNPFDREFYINRAAANAAATRRAITNQSSGNRATAMAGILAADRAYQNSLGDLARQAEEYNLNQREKVATFNRETDRANQTASLQAQAQNQAAQARARQARLAGIQSAETLRSQIDEARNNAINANISSLFGNLGEIGQDEFNRASADWWLTNVAPRLNTKPPYWSNKQWNDYLRLHGENIPEEPTRREKKKQKNEIKNDYNYTTPIDYSGDFWS